MHTSHPIIDLRSDTVTQPSAAMKQAMMAAPLGDDVLGDEPTVAALEAAVAARLGKAAAAFVPSGTMANQLAIRIHTQPGDQIIAHPGSHIYHYEAGAPAALSGCSFAFAAGPRGTFTPADLDQLIRADDHHFPRTRLVCVENTHNAGGGAVWPTDLLGAVAARAHERGLAAHLDGARLWNAAIASGAAPAALAANFDTVSVCFSKGLGAPVGSAIAGPAEAIHRAKRFRKMFGGAMRQSGIIAAAALYAMQENFPRLAEDHTTAKALAAGLAAMPQIKIQPEEVQTNIVYFATPGCDAAKLCRELETQGVRMLPTGPSTIRAVTHLHIDSAMIEQALAAISQTMAGNV